MVEQPARRPHSDCSPRGAHMNLDRAFPGQESFWEGKDFDVLKYASHPPPLTNCLEEANAFMPAFGDPSEAQATTGP